MRQLCLTIVLEFISTFAFSQPDSLRQDSIRNAAPWQKIEPKPTRFIYIHPIHEDAAWLYMTNGGGFGIKKLFPLTVVGTFSLEEEGFRFTPAKEAPKGMMSQKFFERVYPLNSVVKGIYIPYTEIKSVRAYIIIRTKNGKKYHVVCKRPKKVRQEIRARLTTPIK